LELPSRIQEAYAACYHESQIEEAIMDIPVLIQPVPGKGYVARAGSPFDWTAEGSTMDEALANLQTEVSRHLSNGAKAAVISVVNDASASQLKVGASGIINPPKPGENPWLQLAGTLDPNDPMVQEWRKAVEEYRREIDADPNR
jgi:hypothetical protein